MSYEDSFEREARCERAYNGFEKAYLFEHCKPASIGHWEWQLMFGKRAFRDSQPQAAQDAAEMARELRVSVRVAPSVSGDSWWAEPVDYFSGNPVVSGGGNRYQRKLHEFIKALVLAGTYPDMVQAARALKDRDVHDIAQGASDVLERHQQWIAESRGAAA